jgi:TRAP-type uncharacterized transport system substrate-binding protein
LLENTWKALRRDRGLYPLSALAIVIALLGVMAAYWRLIGPTHLTIAVAPREGAVADLVDALSSTLVAGRRGVRLIVQKEASLEAAARKLESGEVDLAVVRPDVALPANGLTVAILRREALLILHPPAQKLEKLADLAGKSIALVAHNDGDEQAIRSLLAFHELIERVRVERIDEAGIGAALSSGRSVAVAFVAAPGSPEARRVSRAITLAIGKPPALLELAHGAAFESANPAFSGGKVASGGLFTAPPLPAEETDGVVVSWRLMARSGMDRGPVSILTERLFESRSLLARASPVALTMEAPELEGATSAVLPNHRGALDYFNREQLTFMDRYGDWLWFALFAATGVSSALAWIGRMFNRRRREIIDEALHRLCRILSEARNAESLQRLSEISTEVDRLVAISVWRARRRTTNARTISALMLAIDAARSAVRERREELAQGQHWKRSVSPQSSERKDPGPGS